VFNNTSLSIAEQEEALFSSTVMSQCHIKQLTTKADNKTEPNGRAMSKVMTMFNGHGRGAELSSAKDTAYGLLCSSQNL
jgi:hypothetical protein